MAVRVLVAFDSFKDTLSAADAGAAVLDALIAERGSEGIIPTQVNLSDGGEGFLSSLAGPLELELLTASVSGPMGSPVPATYGVSKTRGLAVVEMAQASGLELVPPPQRNPMLTTTRGTGELIMKAYEQGYRRIIVGLGGSATNDGGVGALQAMGLCVTCSPISASDFIDGDGYAAVVSTGSDDDLDLTCPFRGRHLATLTSVAFPSDGAPPTTALMSDCSIEMACDVNNPFIGDRGAVAVFSEQKGATESMKVELENGMINLAARIEDLTGRDIRHVPGAGAAGGFAGGFVGLLGSRLTPGMDLIAEAHRLEERVQAADIVFTGEGCFDSQTSGGKVVHYLRQLCERHHKRLVVICGRTKDVDVTESEETFSMYDLVSQCGVDESMNNTAACIRTVVAANIDAILAPLS
eukprot:TRINITY_DN3063_c0_g2_i1.p1 TRINITY_DN3063_c0_g2~~TRINITY_DN3063_c0_g2_i1.p1  ORF type:complete len:410 (+),score=49.63 TRINITY_DN3063_c0_g2_i1:336-1565(+)